MNSLLSVIDKITGSLGSLGTIGLGAGLFAGIKNVGIFRTITDESTGAVKSVGLFGKTLKELKSSFANIKTNGLLNSIFNTSSIDTKAIDAYNKAIIEATKNNVSMTDKQQIMQTAMEGTNKETARLIQSTQGNIVKQKQLKAAQDATTLSAKAEQVALKGLTIAGNMLAGIAISFAINKAIEGIDYLIHREERLEEAFNNAKESAQSFRDEMQNIQKESAKTASSADEIADSYAKLVQGVNPYTNENVSLSNEQYEEFLDLNEQLSNLFPSLTQGYDENGKAILGLGGSIETVTGKIAALVKQQERLAKADLKKNLENYVNGDDENGGQLDVISDYADKLEKEKDKVKEFKNELKTILNGGTDKQDYLNQKSLDKAKKYYKDKFGLTDEELKQATNIETNFLGEGVYRLDFSKLELDEDRKTEILNSYNTFYKDLESGVQTAQAELDNANQEMSDQMMVWVEDMPVFADGGESMQTAITKMVGSIDWSNLGITDLDGAKQYIQQTIFNPISKALDNPDDKLEVTNAISKLFTLDLSKMPVEEAKKAIDGFLTTIMNILNQGVPDNEKKTLDDMYGIFGFDDFEEGSKSFNQSLSDIAGDNTAEMQKLSDYTKDFTYDQQQAWMNATLGAKDAQDAIEKYEASLQKGNKTGTSSDPFYAVWDDESYSKTRTKLEQLTQQGKLSQDTIKSVEDYKNMWKATGLNIESFVAEIQQAITLQDKLNLLSKDAKSMSSAYQEYKKNGKVSSSSLNSLSNDWKNLKGYSKFNKIVRSNKTSKDEKQNAFNSLVTDYINTSGILEELATNTSKKVRNKVITALSDAGVVNSKDVVSSYEQSVDIIDAAKTEFYNKSAKDRATDIKNFQEAIKNKNISFTDACNALGGSNAELMNKLGNQYTDDYINWINLLDKKKIAYNKYVEEYNKAVNDKADKAGITTNVFSQSQAMEAQQMSADQKKKAGLDKIEEKLTEAEARLKPINVSFDGLRYKPTTTSSGSSSSSEKNEKSKSTQIIDWIERRLSVLQTRIDQTKAKFENLYTFSDKKNNLDKQIKQTTALLDTQQKAVQKYKKKADSIKLDDDLKKKVQNGQITGSMDELIATYGEKKANQITKYQDYWDKYIELRKSVDETKKSLKEIRDERDQLVIDRADQNLSTIDAEEEIVGTAKKNNELEQQRVKWIKQSYDAQIRMAEREKDSVKIAELRAKKEKEILDVKKQILQNTLDENEAARNLNDAKAENTTDEKAKDKLAASNLKTYISDINAEKKYQNSIMKVANASDKEKKDIQNSIKATETMGQIAAISSKVLSQKDKDKIVSKIKKGKKIPDDLLKKVEKADVALYQKLTLYNSTLDSSDIQNLLTESETNIEEKKTAIRENIVNTLQRKSDNSEAKYNVLQAQQENVNTSAEKNKLEAESRENLKDQYAYQIAIAKVNGDINEALRLQEEYISKINDSYKKEYDNIKTEYDNINSLNESQISSVQSEISALEAQGKTVSTSFYQSLIGSTATSTNILTEEISKLEEKMADFDYGSEKWYSAKQDLESLNQSLLKNIESVAEFQNKINEIDLSKLNLQTKRLEYTAQQIEFLTDMLSHKDLTSEDAFGLTKEGFATLSLYLDKAQNSLNSVKTISEEWTTFQRQVALGVSNMTAEEIDEKNNEYAESMRSAIKANEEMKDSIKSLVKEAFDVEIDAINELIDKQKERLQKEKELYEYHKKITSQTKNIASLEKQIAALTGDTSEDARMKIQKLNVSLEDAREELQDTEYDQWISDQEDMLDNLAEELSDIFEDVLKNTDALIEQVRDAVTENSGIISDVLNQLGFGTTDLYKTITNADGSKTTETYNYDTGKTTYTDYDANGDLLRAYTMDSNLRNKLYDIFSDRKNFEEEGRTPYGDLTALMYNMLGRNDDGSFRELTLDGLKKVMDAFGMSYELAYAAADGDYSAQNKIAQLLKNAGFGVEKAQTDPLSVANGNWTSLTTNTTNISKDVGNIKTSLNQIYDVAKQYLTSQGIDVFSAFSSANGFATGGIAQASGILKKTGEDGFVLARNGEGFVRPEDVPAIKELMATVPTVNDMMGNIMSLRNIPTYAKEPSQSVNIGNYQQIIELPDVTDPKSFVKTFNNSREMQKAVQDATIKQTIKQYNNRLG